jgi:hypothetical protein
MSEPRKAANLNVSTGYTNYGTDDTGVPVWSEADEEMVSGRNWSVILVFVFVPLMALIVLAISLYALFAHVFSAPQAPETVIENTKEPS